MAKELTKAEKLVLRNRWMSKRKSIHNLANKIDSLKRAVRKDLNSDNEKDQLTALVIRIMMRTSERIGNELSGSGGHLGITEFRNKNVSFEKPAFIIFDYVGKSGVEHCKRFSDAISYALLKDLKSVNKEHIFTTSDGFRIRPNRVNRYLRDFDVKSKDVRGFNANHLMVAKLSDVNIKEPKERKKYFNEALRSVAEKIGHGGATCRKHYLLPEIEEEFYRTGTVKKVEI